MNTKRNKSVEEQLTQLAHFWEKQQPRKNHRLRFENKLKAQQNKRPVRTIRPIYWAAATLALLVSSVVSLQFFNSKPVNSDFDKAIVYYTQYIDKQMAEIEHSDNIQYVEIIDDTKEQLTQLDKEYKRLMNEFNSKAVHPALIQAMVENLQHQAMVLRELETKINSLKNTDYEKEIL